MVKKVVTISDVHIGTNSIGCWFNAGYHGPYLNAIFDYIVKNKDTIDELVILGDLFDQWVYAPDVRPPSILEIINHKDNNKIFGLDTPLDKAVTAMNGNVSYVNGNHDMNVTQEDLDKIPLSNNFKIKKQDDKYMINKTLFTHGNLYTIFNAPPYPRVPPTDTPKVPLGHFVTRLITYKIAKGGIPAYEITEEGAPALMQMVLAAAYVLMKDFILKFFKGGESAPGLVSEFIDIWVQVTGFPTDGTFLMADGTTKTITDVKNEYKDLFKDWIDKHNKEYVEKSVYVDAMARSMSWFTQQDGLIKNANMVVTGHTHWPTLGVAALVGDVNCGFECTPKPDMIDKKRRYTFAVIDGIDKPITKGALLTTAKVFEITENNGVYTPTESTGIPLGEIDFNPKPLGPFKARDFSVYVRMYNNTAFDMTLGDHSIAKGKWTVEPPKVLPANSSVGFWVQDKFGTEGSTGKVTYLDKDGNKYELDFSCPTLGFNSATFTGVGSTVLGAKVGDGPWTFNPVGKLGHPVSLEVGIGNV